MRKDYLGTTVPPRTPFTPEGLEFVQPFTSVQTSTAAATPYNPLEDILTPDKLRSGIAAVRQSIERLEEVSQSVEMTRETFEAMLDHLKQQGLIRVVDRAKAAQQGLIRVVDRAKAAQQGYTGMTIFGMKVVIDDTLEPGSFEFRNPRRVYRKDFKEHVIPW